jgi:hypothetical protein
MARDCLSLNKAIDELHAGATLMKSHSDDEFYVVSRGRVARTDVPKLFQRLDLVVDSGGLFPLQTADLDREAALMSQRDFQIGYVPPENGG